MPSFRASPGLYSTREAPWGDLEEAMQNTSDGGEVAGLMDAPEPPSPLSPDADSRLPGTASEPASCNEKEGSEPASKEGRRARHARAMTMSLDERKSVNSYDIQRANSGVLSDGEERESKQTTTREALMASTYVRLPPFSVR
jgi:hypothetical protein